MQGLGLAFRLRTTPRTLNSKPTHPHTHTHTHTQSERETHRLAETQRHGDRDRGYGRLRGSSTAWALRTLTGQTPRTSFTYKGTPQPLREGSPGEGDIGNLGDALVSDFLT